MNDYEERKQARIDRYRERAEKARQRSGQLSHESISMLEHIPPGQPILVGHHSERGHRKLLERSDRKMEQSIAASEKADYYERKARAAENNTAISSDDPAALEKLRAKLAQLQEDQTFMKKVNAYYRKHQTCRGCEGVSPELAAKLDNSMENAYSWENAPYAVTWDLGDGDRETTSQTYGQALVLPDTPSKTGHTFIGWFTAESGGTQVTDSTVYTTAGPATYYARWEAQKYTITWDLGDGRTETTSQTYGEKLVLPTQPLKDGYTFLGWFTAESGGTQVTGDEIYTGTGPATYYAHWELLPVFSVTVPMSLALTVSERGEVYAATGAAIVNHSTAPVRVSEVTVSAVNGWTLVPYDTDMAGEKVDSRLLGFALNGAETSARGGSEALALTGDWTIPLDGSLPLTYDAVVSALSQPVDERVVSIVFVLEWA